jgi:hypothetical protein
MSNGELFASSEQTKGLTCNTCEHRQRWECGGRIIQYCGNRHSNRTENKLLKIKCKTAACGLYKPVTNANPK